MIRYFENLLETINTSIKSLDIDQFNALLDECIEALRMGNQIVVSGLGKNVPICDKFVGTMVSLGQRAAFLHTNSAVHGDLGIVKKNDLVIVLTKSGETAESIYLVEQLKKKHANIWLLTFQENSTLTHMISKCLVLRMDHEGDLWNIVPNNSTTLNLIVLQAIAIKSAERNGVSIEEFKLNHPGGHIGVKLKNA